MQVRSSKDSINSFLEQLAFWEKNKKSPFRNLGGFDLFIHEKKVIGSFEEIKKVLEEEVIYRFIEQAIFLRGSQMTIDKTFNYFLALTLKELNHEWGFLK